MRDETERLAAIVADSRSFIEDVPDQEALLATVAERVAERTGDGCSVRLLSDDGGELLAAGAYHPDPTLRAAIRSMTARSVRRADIGIWRRVIEDREIVRVAVQAGSLPADATPEQARFAARWPVRHLLLVPLIARGRVTGGIGLSRYSNDTPFTPAEESYLRDLADRAALALDNARLYRDLQRANAELEERVRERTAQLADATVAAEAASRAKTAFLSSMSHELRTPLNAVMGFTYLLEEQAGPLLTEEHRRYLGHISDAGHHLLALINDALDLERIEAGRLELRPETIALSALLGPVTSSTALSARAAGLEFVAAPPPDALVEADPLRLRQVLYNLLSNAVKFTRPPGRVELVAAVSGADLDLCVRDTGLGIPEASHARVFGTFERFHPREADIGGAGLGLALTKRLVEAHGGTIGFTSREGEGSEFRVRLPGVVRSPAAA